MISASHQWSQRWPGSSRSRWMNSWKVSSAELKWSVNAPSSTSCTARRSASSGIPSPCALDQPEDHALALPPRRVGHQLGLVGLDRPAHLPPGADPVEAGVGQPARAGARRRRTRRCRSAGRSARARRRPRAPAPRPTRTARRCTRSASRSSSVAVDDVDEEHPALGAVVHAAPGPDRAVGVADDEVLPHRAGRARRPRPGPRPRRSRPSRGRRARGRAAARSAARRSPGRRRRACPAAQPAGSPGSSGSDVGGVALEPVVLRDHERSFFRTRRRCAVLARSRSDRRRAVVRRR